MIINLGNNFFIHGDNMTDIQQHWNNIFSSKSNQELGWYEHDAAQTLKFFNAIPKMDSPLVFLPGAGTSVLVEELLSIKARLILNDISAEALHKLKTGLKQDDGQTIWLHHDISKPLPNSVPQCDIWIDRAVLHFLLSESDINGYFDNLYASVKKGGYALLAEFSTNGAPKCAGLELHRYSADELTNRMGTEFELVMQEDYTFINPFGDPRPYIYALYKRK